MKLRLARSCCVLMLAYLIGACASGPDLPQEGNADSTIARPSALRWRSTPSFSSLVTSRSASVVEIRTLRDQCRAGVFPVHELAPRVVELRRRYLLLSIPIAQWVVLP